MRNFGNNYLPGKKYLCAVSHICLERVINSADSKIDILRSNLAFTPNNQDKAVRFNQIKDEHKTRVPCFFTIELC